MWKSDLSIAVVQGVKIELNTVGGGGGSEDTMKWGIHSLGFVFSTVLFHLAT